MPFYNRISYDTEGQRIEVNQSAKTLTEALDQEIMYFLNRKIIKVIIEPQE